jgi:hypothetical protein
MRLREEGTKSERGNSREREKNKLEMINEKDTISSKGGTSPRKYIKRQVDFKKSTLDAVRES